MTVPAALPVSGSGGDVTFDWIETALSLQLVSSWWEGVPANKQLSRGTLAV